MNILEIKPPFIKLDQALKFSGIVYSGGDAKELILDGKVSVNNEVCLLRGKKLYEGDTFSFQNETYEVKFKQ